MERYELATERIRQIPKEDLSVHFGDFFVSMAEFVIDVDELKRDIDSGKYENYDFETLQSIQEKLYAQILPQNYNKSFFHPDVLFEKYGEEFGQVLCVLARELRSIIPMAYERKEENISSVLEVFLEIYTAAKEEDVTAKQLEDIFFWYMFDYLDVTVPERVRETLTPQNHFIRDIIENADLNDLRYLFLFGQYISNSEIAMAKYLNALPEETIKKMADTYTQGYQKGFVVLGKDLSKVKNVSLHCPIGFERVVKVAIQNFLDMGLEPILYRTPYRLADIVGERSRGCGGQSPNRQYDYDHRFDGALILKKAFTDRKLALLEMAYEENKEILDVYAGPAVIETFGEKSFVPVNTEHALSYSDKQKKLRLDFSNEFSMLLNRYVQTEKTSFTIIAWPLPDIVEDKECYRKIFDEIIRINTLDYQHYQRMQQIIIDALDQAECVHVQGGQGNDTDVTVKLHSLKDPKKQTNFENCVADVNIPVGEVFTSPVLKGTNGLLHVGRVYIGDILFKDLRLWFCDGMVSKYSCQNFENESENQSLIEEVLLKNRKSLPLGEFAIGTNTTAYAVAKKYQIFNQLPILIAEKMGPHFAIGDTCYSHEEDEVTYNPDGKAIIAKDNEVSLLRHSNREKAYMNCHTDITIPYDELGDIHAICADGKEIAIVVDGKFALEGLEELNEAMG